MSEEVSPLPSGESPSPADPRPDDAAPPAPAPAPAATTQVLAEREPEDELSPIAPEFWLGQVFAVLGVLLAIFLAAQAGFEEAARLEVHEELRLSRNKLRLVRAEVEANLAQVEEAHAALEAGHQASLEIYTDYLDAIAAEPLPWVQPSLIPDLVKLFTHPLPSLVEALGTRSRIAPREVEYIKEVLSDVTARSGALLEQLAEAEASLDALLEQPDGVIGTGEQAP
jgi:hypothetical protein